MMILRSLLVACALLLASVSANAATLISTATGNINSTGTWSVVDTTGTNSFLNSETGSTVVTTSFVASSSFTPVLETITGFAVKLAIRTGTTGTLTAKINDTTTALDKCTVTVNTADLVSAASATAEGGWIVFGGCNFLTTGTDVYTIQVTTSSAAQVTLWTNGTAANWSRFLITSGTQSGGPAAGDKFYVFGNLTGAGTGNTFTVTMNTTSGTTYGNVANTLVDPSIAIGQGGTLAYGSTAATAYLMQFSGPVVAYNGGVFTIGTNGTPIPASGSATLTMVSTVEGDTGLNFRNGATFNSVGSSGGRTVVKTLLTSTANASATSLTVADSTGWLSGDSLVIAGTTPTSSDAASKYDAVAMSGNASGTTLPVAAITNQHTAVPLSYTSSSTGNAYAFNMYPAVINLTRNVIIQGNSSTTNGYVFLKANSVGVIAWTQFSQMSGTGATAGSRGLEVDTGPLGSFSLTNSAFINAHNTCLVLAGSNTTFGGTQGAYLLVQHNVMYNCANTSVTAQTQYGFGILSVVYNPYWTVDDFTVIRTAYASFNSAAFWLSSVNGNVTNITVSGSGNGSVGAFKIVSVYSSTAMGIGGGVGNVVGPINLYANAGYPFQAVNNSGITGTFAGLYIWHESGRFSPPNVGAPIFDPFFIVSSTFGVYIPSGSGANPTFRNGVIGWDVTQVGAQFPLTVDTVNVNVIFDNMDLCPVGSVGGVTFLACAGASGANDLISLNHDIGPTGSNTYQSSKVFLRNSALLNSITTNYPNMGAENSFYGDQTFVVQDCNACTPLKHAAWLPGGFAAYDTAITHSSGYSLRMVPKVSTFSGYISSGAGSTAVGTVLTITSGTPAFAIADALASNGSGFIPGSSIISGSGTSFVVNLPQSVGSSGSPVVFLQYFNNTGTLLRMKSAPFGYGQKVAVASGQVANVCVWLRPSSSGDAAPTWGGSAVTYSGDQPRMILRQNPYMGVQTDTVLATASLSTGTWAQLCANTPTAPADGMFEIVVDADQTFTSNIGGSVNVTEWSCTNCGSLNGGQFWWNGAPADAIAPASTGGGRIIGG